MLLPNNQNNWLPLVPCKPFSQQFSPSVHGISTASNNSQNFDWIPTSCRTNFLLHALQSKGRSPVWPRVCRTSSSLLPNLDWHKLEGKTRKTWFSNRTDFRLISNIQSILLNSVPLNLFYNMIFNYLLFNLFMQIIYLLVFFDFILKSYS